MLAYRVITPPTIEPITLDEAKGQCRVETSMHDEDATIAGYIRAAREHCEKIDWRAYCTQTIELWLNDWPGDDEILLPRPPLQSVIGVTYYDVADVEHTLAAADYFVDVVSEPGRVHLRNGKTWPATSLRDYNAVCVTYLAGWATAALVPQTIKQAMLLLIGHWYDNREDSTTGAVNRSIELGVKALLGIDRAFRF